MKNVKRDTPDFISNKLLIIIAIFITVLFIVLICYSMGKKEGLRITRKEHEDKELKKEVSKIES